MVTTIEIPYISSTQPATATMKQKIANKKRSGGPGGDSKHKQHSKQKQKKHKKVRLLLLRTNLACAALPFAPTAAAAALLLLPPPPAAAVLTLLSSPSSLHRIARTTNTHRKHATQPNPQGGGQLQDAPLPSRGSDSDGGGGDGGSAGGSESEVEVSDEDVAFVQQHARKIGFLKDLDTKVLDK